jgi:predicted nucleic acid-binding protein
LTVYVDTSAWIAFLTERDTHHAEAVETLTRLARQRVPLRTGQHTWIELADGIAARKGQAEAARILEAMLGDARLRVMASGPVYAKAWTLFTQRTDWKVDLSDCMSFALMEALAIRQAFTYDRDFEKAGFEIVG